MRGVEHMLKLSLARNSDAGESGLIAVLAAGAFLGMSNVMAVEAASLCRENSGEGVSIQETRFNYFTAGLGGSGDVNLYTTNLGLGVIESAIWINLWKNILLSVGNRMVQ